MPAVRANPNRIKRHRSYTAGELADRFGIHKNTVRHWRQHGLAPIDGNRPVLFHGEAVRAFLAKRNADRKCPCPPGTLFCLKCRAPRAPALGMVEYLPITAASGNLRALCEHCETMMHRRVRRADIERVMPGLSLQITQAAPRLNGQASPSLNCDSTKRG